MTPDQNHELIDQLTRMSLTLGKCMVLIDRMYLALDASDLNIDDITLLKEEIFKNIDTIFYG